MVPETKRELWYRFWFRLPPLEERVRAKLLVEASAPPVRRRKRARWPRSTKI
jgi:hypothetical protein